MSLLSFMYPVEVVHGSDNLCAYFPDLPGCVTTADTIAEMRMQAKEALSLHLEGMLEDGDVLPEPSAPEDLDPKAHILWVRVQVPAEVKVLDLV